MSHSQYLDSIETSHQPLDFVFHPQRDNLLAAALVDGTLEVHDIRKEENDDDDDDDEFDSLLSSLSLHTQMIPPSQNKDVDPSDNLRGFKETGTIKSGPSNTQNSNKCTPAACKSVSFSVDGTKIYTGGSAGDLCAVDAERACTFSVKSDEKRLLWRVEPATEGKYNPLVAIRPFDGSVNLALMATGDDAGGVRVWDQRICGNSTSSKANSYNQKRPQGCVLSWKEHEDYISGLEHSLDGNTLLATSADCRLGVYDLRMPKERTNTSSFRLSDDQEDELLSLKIMKHGKKVVCGTQEGVLAIFSWGTWGDVSDRFPGHPNSIDALLKVDEDTLLTGSSDGLIRVVQIQPDKLLGMIGDDHGGFPIEKLDFNNNRHVIGSLSHSNYIRLWDARVLTEDQDDGNDDDGENNDSGDEERKMPGKLSTKRGPQHESDDEWDDMDGNNQDSEEDDGDSNDDDNDDDDNDDDDSDDSDEKPETINDKRKKRLKTENEKFFEDL